MNTQHRIAGFAVVAGLLFAPVTVSAIATFSDVASFLTMQNPLRNASGLSSQLTAELQSGGGTVSGFTLPTFTFDLPAETTMNLANDLNVGATTVPEPSTLLLASCIAALAVWRKRLFPRV